jgi:hypothetical protein
MKQFAFLIPASLLACAPASSPEGAAADPSASSYAFDIQLTLTPRTIDKLEGMHEMVTVSAMYWGEPVAEARTRADGMGQINLGADDIKVQPASRIVVIPGAAIDPKVLASDVDGSPQVLVNVYTSRMAHENNLINCGIYEGPIAMAQQKPVDIRCDLIDPPADIPTAAILANPN